MPRELQIERELSRTEAGSERTERLASLLTLSYEPMLVWQLNGPIEFWNTGAERLYGFAPEEAIGRSSHALLQTKFPIEFSEWIRQLQNERYCSGELRHICKHGREVIVESRQQLLSDGTVIEVNRDVTEQKRTRDQIATLAREAEHRSKNLLATVQATVNLSQSDTSEGLKRAIEGRIQALANVNSLFVDSRWIGAELSAIATREFAPYSQKSKTRVRINGAQVLLEPSAAQTIAVILHELATNAVKYGALSAANGQVDLQWSHEAGERLHLRWTETGGAGSRDTDTQGLWPAGY